jgi:hypothetical protein
MFIWPQSGSSIPIRSWTSRRTGTVDTCRTSSLPQLPMGRRLRWYRTCLTSATGYITWTRTRTKRSFPSSPTMLIIKPGTTSGCCRGGTGVLSESTSLVSGYCHILVRILTIYRNHAASNARARTLTGLNRATPRTATENTVSDTRRQTSKR